MASLRDINDPEYIYTCTKCGIPKANKEFARDFGLKTRKYVSQCKECRSIRKQLWNARAFQTLYTVTSPNGVDHSVHRDHYNHNHFLAIIKYEWIMAKYDTEGHPKPH